MHIFIFCTVLAVFFWSVIKPADYSTWLLEVSPAVIILAFFLFLYRKFPLTTLSYLIIAFVTILMFIGGHYIYSKVPLFEWLKDKFELQRNHYDRFGHLMKGLSVIVVREILLRKTELTEGSWLKGISLSIVLALAALYEIAEWLVSKLGGGGQASKNFLGTQGDIWDSQWDMTLTLIGAIISLFLLQKTHDRFLKREIKK
ncbi:DUF2238 domain-containing protein [Bacillus sp. REN3]|uniref:DUF2238 domain-containing protein n=1 Tax=Bacillus sp. REN3 TaxID=2802440 RepID=UPI001AEEC2CC|nr:DUF2238 domain-containing protein [Bacillus sp. REN3]